MENKQIKYEIDEIKRNLEGLKKHISSLFGDVMWDLDKELKNETEYRKLKISNEILNAWKEIERLENYIENIEDNYNYASKEPEESEETEIIEK